MDLNHPFIQPTMIMITPVPQFIVLCTVWNLDTSTTTYLYILLVFTVTRYNFLHSFESIQFKFQIFKQRLRPGTSTNYIFTRKNVCKFLNVIMKIIFKYTLHGCGYFTMVLHPILIQLEYSKVLQEHSERYILRFVCTIYFYVLIKNIEKLKLAMIDD